MNRRGKSDKKSVQTLKKKDDEKISQHQYQWKGALESIRKIDKSWARLIKEKKKGQILKSIKFDVKDNITNTLEIAKDHKRLQQAAISQ